MLDVCDAHPISGGVSEAYDVSPDDYSTIRRDCLVNGRGCRLAWGENCVVVSKVKGGPSLRAREGSKSFFESTRGGTIAWSLHLQPTHATLAPPWMDYQREGG